MQFSQPPSIIAKMGRHLTPYTGEKWRWPSYLEKFERQLQASKLSVQDACAFLSLLAPADDAQALDAAFLDMFNHAVAVDWTDQMANSHCGQDQMAESHCGQRGRKATIVNSQNGEPGEPSDAKSGVPAQPMADEPDEVEQKVPHVRTKTVVCPMTGSQHEVSETAQFPLYSAYRQKAIQIVAGPQGADECYAALRALRHDPEKALSVHISNFRSHLKIYATLTSMSLNSPMLATLFEESLAPDTISEMATFPKDLEASIAEAQRAHAKAAKKAAHALRHGSAAAPLTRHAINAFSNPPSADPSTRAISDALNAASGDFKFLQTVASMADVDLNWKAALACAPERTADLRAVLQSRLSRCTTQQEALNAMTNLMPKDLVRQVESTRRETATYEFAGLDQKGLQQSYALRQAADGLRSRGSSEFAPLDEEEAEERPKQRRRTRATSATVSSFDHAYVDSDSAFEHDDEFAFQGRDFPLEDSRDDVAVNAFLAHAETVAVYTADARSHRGCHHCKDPSHRVKDCPKLVDEAGHRRPYCPFCRKAGHLVTACEVLKDAVCSVCRAKGHSASTCKQVVCKKCGEKGHIQWRCPKNGFRGR